MGLWVGLGLGRGGIWGVVKVVRIRMVFSSFAQASECGLQLPSNWWLGGLVTWWLGALVGFSCLLCKGQGFKAPSQSLAGFVQVDIAQNES